MKRTQQVNIGRISFFIDEDAYQRLQEYLGGIEQYYQTSEEGAEILADIELRMAEILQERVSRVRQSISLADVEEVIGTMGEPEEFDEDNTRKKASNFNTKNYKQMERRRIFRNADDKILGGVCAGLAAYIGIKANIVRAIFVVATFIAGSSVVLYGLLWVFVPEARTTSERIEMQGAPLDMNEVEATVRSRFQRIREQLGF